jgi:predicted DNA-binding transcriptional regulator YafY
MWNVEVMLHLTLERARQILPLTLINYTLEYYPQGVLLRAWVESLDWMARFLTGLQCSFLIVHPTELKMTLRTIVEEMLRLAQ